MHASHAAGEWQSLDTHVSLTPKPVYFPKDGPHLSQSKSTLIFKVQISSNSLCFLSGGSENLVFLPTVLRVQTTARVKAEAVAGQGSVPDRGLSPGVCGSSGSV